MSQPVTFVRRSDTHCKRSGMDNPDPVFDSLEMQASYSNGIILYTRIWPSICCVCGSGCNQYVKFIKDEDTKVTRFAVKSDKDCCVIGTCCMK